MKSYSHYTIEALQLEKCLLEEKLYKIEQETVNRKNKKVIIRGVETIDILSEVSLDKTWLIDKKSKEKISFEYSIYRDDDATIYELTQKDYNITVEGICHKNPIDKENQYIAVMIAKHRALAEFNKRMVEYIIEDSF